MIRFGPHRGVSIAVAMAFTIAATLPAQAGPSFSETVAAAWSRLPQRQLFEARRHSADANFRAGSALFPNAPALSGNYANDHVVGSNVGYVTAQVELSTPVWLPGEGTATQRAALAQEVASSADETAAHLALAEEVLDLATGAVLADDASHVAADRLATAQALANAAAERFRTGEASESDYLAAAAEAANARIELNDAAAKLQAARAALTATTGSSAVPDLGADASAPPGPTTVAFGNDPVLPLHPKLVAEDRHVAAAEESERLVRIQNRDDPEIGVQVIDDKQPGTRWDTRVALTFRLPFATEARNAPRRAAAEEQVTQAVVGRELARRAVLLQVTQAETRLAAARLNAQQAMVEAAALSHRQRQIRHAWLAGETPLIELVRANDVAAQAQFDARKAQTELASAGIGLRLARGTLP